MSYKNERYMKLVKDFDKSTSKTHEVTDQPAEEDFKTILTWKGEEPNHSIIQICLCRPLLTVRSRL